MKINTYDFIWNCFSPRDIEKMVEQAELHQSAVRILWMIDTFDVVENFLPYTEVNLFSTGDKNRLAQEFICYDYLFSDQDKNKIIVATEYRDELLAVKNKLQKQLLHVEAVFNNLKKLKKETPDFNDEVIAREFLEKHFEIILLLLIMNEKKRNVFEQFLDFTRERLDVAEIRIDNKEDAGRINEIFDETKPTTQSIEIFKKFVDHNKLSIASIDTESERHIFLDNTFRDIKVAERIMVINQKLKSEKINYRVFYLSSAKKTGQVMSTVKEVFGDEEPDFHRNIYQYFLSSKLKSEFEAEPGKTIKILSDLLDARGKVEKLQKDAPPIMEHHNDLLKTVEEIFSQASSSIDNHFFISVFNKYRFEPDSGFTDKNGQISHKQIRKILLDIDQNRESLMSQASVLEGSIGKIESSLDGYSLMPDFTRRTPKDIIQNAYQYVPILPFLTQGNELIANLYHIIDRMIELEKFDGSERKEEEAVLLALLNELYSVISGLTSTKDRYLKKLVVSYITFIGGNKIQSDEDLITFFKMELQLIEAQGIGIDLTGDQKAIHYSYNPGPLGLEIAYILIWLYRRNKKMEEGAQLAIKYLEHYPGNARLLHGLALCYHVQDYDRFLEEKTNDIFLKPFEVFHSALQQYEVEIKNYKNESVIKLFRKTQSAILNSLANIKMRRYALGLEDIEAINDAQNYLNQIKLLLAEVKQDFNEHVTYLATQVELLYMVALNNREKQHLSLALDCVTKASLMLSALKKLTNYHYTNDFFKERFKKIPELMNELMLKK